MIDSVHIQNFKSIEEQFFIFKPITILTGTNSSGKSSIIQAILLYSNYANKNDVLDGYLLQLGGFVDLLRYYSKTKTFSITPTLKGSKKSPSLKFNKESGTLSFSVNGKVLVDNFQAIDFPVFERDIYYISANRIGQENLPNNNDGKICGVNGEYIFGFYNRKKGELLPNRLLLSNDAVAHTLEANVGHWLKEILKLNLIPRTEKITNTNIKLLYENIDLENFRLSPFNLGAGVSYLTKILILGLSLKEGDILIVENPEAHLHPKSISRFAEFFAFLAEGGIQVILETHSEHIINKMRYLVFEEKISKDNIQIYYKERFDIPFKPMQINKMGKYIDSDNNIIEFPSGFFDGDLEELLRMM